MTRPFIYIAALRRTGSTVLSESLTSFPDSFIFREPKLGRRRFTVKANDAKFFLEHGLDLNAFSQKYSGGTFIDKVLGKNRIMKAFETELMPQLLSVFQQIGTKEIHHRGWQHYAEAFPNIKVILTCRDPRDIFISTYYRVREGKDRFPRGFSARELARNLNKDFIEQKKMFLSLPSIKIRYEDLCGDDNVLDEIKAFVESGIKGVGEIGQFNASNPQRTAEAQLHGNKITKVRAGRWVQEADKDVVKEAHRMFDHMPEFVEFWGYER